MRISRAGLLITLIPHLALLCVLLSVKLRYARLAESSFVLDFSRQEEQEREEARQQRMEDISRSLDGLIERMRDNSEASLRSVASERTPLRDDRNTNAEDLYRKAAELAGELEAGKARGGLSEEDFGQLAPESPQDKTPAKEGAAYSGPSVLYWSMDGRRALRLPIPAYRCYGAGEVTVILTIDRKGKPLHARVDESVSSQDKCLREFAVRAAMASRFSIGETAPQRQQGTITYAFLQQ